jgi:hypothetical protein
VSREVLGNMKRRAERLAGAVCVAARPFRFIDLELRLIRDPGPANGGPPRYIYTVAIACPWRIDVDGLIVCGSGSVTWQEGAREAHVDWTQPWAQEYTGLRHDPEIGIWLNRLQHQRLEAVRVRDGTFDLALHWSSGARLRTFTDSTCYFTEPGPDAVVPWRVVRELATPSHTGIHSE